MSRAGIRPEKSAWLDVGCGQGELLRIGMGHFRRVSGCDLSTGMLEFCKDLKVTPQTEPTRLPFPDQSFDLITSVCVYHHVEAKDRPALTAEIVRAVGHCLYLEHHPFNPGKMHLLTSGTAHRRLTAAGLASSEASYFHYFPERVFRSAQKIESCLRRVPAGGQYAAFARKLE